MSEKWKKKVPAVAEQMRTENEEALLLARIKYSLL